MYTRVINIKFPNELAKKSVIALSRAITKDHFKQGLLIMGVQKTKQKNDYSVLNPTVKIIFCKRIYI